jgi:peptide/nickel transport system permease protein
MPDLTPSAAVLDADPVAAHRPAAKTIFVKLWRPLRALAALMCFSFLGPFAWRQDFSRIDAASVLSAPSWAHPLGTDVLGRDELARLMQGGATTLSVAVAAAAVAFVLGLAYGLCAGLGGAWLDRVLMRLLDAVLALPSLVVLICFSALMQANDAAMALLIGLVAWPPLARLVRNEAAALRQRDFILSAQQLGGSPAYIAIHHICPVMGRLLAVNATFLVADAILSLTSLSFLGLAVQPPRTSWGQLLGEGVELLALHAWWLVLPPGLLITASLFAADSAGRALLLGRQGA